MANNNDINNLLPESEQREAKELLAKQGRERAGEVKLVMPKMDEEKMEAPKKEKLSWIERRRKKKEEKHQAKLRGKGETGTADRSQRKEYTDSAKKTEKPEIFSKGANPPQDKQPSAEKKVEELKKKEEPPMMPSDPKPDSKPDGKPMAKGASLSSMSKNEMQKKGHKKEDIQAKPKPPEQSKSGDIAKNAGSRGSMHQGQTLEGYSSPTMNLVPESVAKEAQERPSWGIGASFLVLILAVWVIIGGIGYSRAQKAESAVAALNSELGQVNKLITNYDSGKSAAQSLQKQLTTVDSLIDEHVYWTLILQKLEEVTIPDVYYTSLNSDITLNKIHLRAIAKDYATAARQIRAIERSPDFVKEVLVGEVRLENQPDTPLPVPIVAFGLEIDLVDDVLFLQNPEDLN